MQMMGSKLFRPMFIISDTDFMLSIFLSIWVWIVWKKPDWLIVMTNSKKWFYKGRWRLCSEQSSIILNTKSTSAKHSGPSIIFFFSCIWKPKTINIRRKPNGRCLCWNHSKDTTKFPFEWNINRHWDGYWFGKYEMWGDVFLIIGAQLTAVAYYYHSLCFQDASYLERAKNIVRNNLLFFSLKWQWSCAYLYPSKVDGVKAQFYDPYANDQDWLWCIICFRMIKYRLIVV